MDLYAISLSGSGIGCIVSSNILEVGSGAVSPIMITKGETKVSNNYVVSSSGQCIVIDADNCTVVNNDLNCLATSAARCIQVHPNHKNVIVSQNKVKTSQTSGTVYVIYNRSNINIAIVGNTIFGANHIIQDDTGMSSYKESNRFVSDVNTNTLIGQYVYGTAAPTSTPNFIGQEFIDTTQ
jgi:hypothetical protein